MRPKLTIITPSYNQGDYIEETILSVLNQRYANLEYFIVDGGSTDTTIDIIKKYNDKISWWITEKDGGQTDAINKGIKRSSGDIIIWINSDDLLEPGALDYISNLFSNDNSIDMAHGNAILFGRGRDSKLIGNSQSFSPSTYIASIPFPQPSFYIRKRVFDLCGDLDPSYNFGMDCEFLARAFLAGFKIQHVNRTLSRYRMHSESKSSDFSKFCVDWSRTFSKVLQSVPGRSREINAMRQCDIFYESSDRYYLGIQLDTTQWSDALLHHLNLRAHILYQSSHVRDARKAINAIKQYDQAYYAKCNLRQLYIRSLLPGWVLKGARSIFRGTSGPFRHSRKTVS